MRKTAKPIFKNKGRTFLSGARTGIPISLGYFAVAFSLGIAARNAGLTPLQSTLASLLCNASAGEFSGFTSIAAQASYIEIAIITFIANARYLLMSCAMSQHMAPGTPLYHRLLTSYTITDEIFGVSIARPGYVNPYFTYGVFCVACPGWALGTTLGTIAGNILPIYIVSALSVALFGMFLAVIIPPARKNKIIAGLVIICFLLSFAASKLPLISDLTEGTRIIILTIVIASVAAIVFPKCDESEEIQ